MTTERDLRLSIEMARARKAWKKAHPGFAGRLYGVIEDSFGIVIPCFDAGYADGFKAALEDHADCHPSDDVDACTEAVKASSRE